MRIRYVKRYQRFELVSNNNGDFVTHEFQLWKAKQGNLLKVKQKLSRCPLLSFGISFAQGLVA